MARLPVVPARLLFALLLSLSWSSPLLAQRSDRAVIGGVVTDAQGSPVPGATVSGLTVLYYPYYGYTLQRLDGSRRQGLVDGLTGEVKQPADR